MSVRPAVSTLTAPATTSRFVLANGVKLHLLDYGGEGKPTLLCLHGGGAHAHWFDFVAPAFTSRFHVLSLDQRGHGDSAWVEPPAYDYVDFVGDLNAVVNTLGLQDFCLMGHSMGGMVSLLYMAQYPAQVRSLIVLDSTLQISAKHMDDLKERGVRGGKAFATLEDYIADFRLRPIETVAAPEMLRYMAGWSARRYEDGLWRHKIDRRMMGTRTPVDGVPSWSKVNVPALLVKAGLSQRVSPAIIAGIKARCPHVELAEVPDSEHHIPLDNPAGLIPVVDRFLSRHFPGRP